MSKITLADLIQHGACGLFVEVVEWSPPTGSPYIAPAANAKPVKFSARVKAKSGNGDAVAVRADPNEALTAAVDLWMESAKRTAEREKATKAAPSAPEKKRQRVAKPVPDLDADLLGVV